MWYVIFRDDSPDGGKTPGRLCVANKEFVLVSDAYDYALTVSQSREPRVVGDEAVGLIAYGEET